MQYILHIKTVLYVINIEMTYKHEGFFPRIGSAYFLNCDTSFKTSLNSIGSYVFAVS